MSLFRFIEIHSCILGLFLGKNKKYLDGFNTIDANVRVEFRRINERRVRVEIWYHKGAQPFENVQDRLSMVEKDVKTHVNQCYQSWEWLEGRKNN